MHGPGSILATALTLTWSTALAQDPWADVKSWSGTVTIEATDKRTGEAATATLTYTATGAFTIVDEAMPDGAHMQWPMPGPETLSDPAQAAAAFERWQARVVARFEFRGTNEMGEPLTTTCAADSRVRSGVGVAIDPTNDEYVFSVTPPSPEFTCEQSSAAVGSTGFLLRSAFSLRGPRGEPGQVSNTQTFTIETTTVTVSFTMTPTK